MYERQDSNSKLNIIIHMDESSDEIFRPSECTTYAVPGIFTFDSTINQCNECQTSAEREDLAHSKMTENGALDTSENNLFPCNSCETRLVQQNNGHDDRSELFSPGATFYEEANITPKDEKIFEAVNEALTSGSLTPLIKEELKCAIQSRRLKEGKNELKVEFSSEPKTFELSEEEVVKVENRRVQNRVAAQRFRERQKQKADELQRKCHRIESHNTQLRYELKKLREQKEHLRKSLEDHLKICPMVSQSLFTTPR